ncbi:hypothetical protein ACIPSA_28715 [Streptomyces sp. NPDC086549]|uniref:hypothetical protein n=1 Tax=Streptomyces sp. NPDC086549 TaxID=3365752 RepID=UPI0037FA312A
MHDTRDARGALAVPDGVVTRAGRVRDTAFTGPRPHPDLEPDLPDTEGTQPA